MGSSDVAFLGGMCVFFSPMFGHTQITKKMMKYRHMPISSHNQDDDSVIPIWFSIILSNMGFIYQRYQNIVVTTIINHPRITENGLFKPSNMGWLMIVLTTLVGNHPPFRPHCSRASAAGPHLCRSWPSLPWSMRFRRPGERVA